MENYADRKESDIFVAIAKQIIHFKSDITTSMGLPAPLMALFNLLQFGSIEKKNRQLLKLCRECDMKVMISFIFVVCQFQQC